MDAVGRIDSNGSSWECNSCSFQNSQLTNFCQCCGSISKSRKSSNNVTKRNFRKIALFCQENCMSFIDDSFPHSQKSIIGGYSEFKVHDSVQWMRPQQIRFSKSHCSDPTLPLTVMNNPMPSDVKQGHLGDCWLLGALANITDHPDILDRIFISKKYNPYGIYALRLFKDGLLTEVIVDDFFPCDSRGEMIFSKIIRNQLWVALVEKAMAKLFGGYAALHGGKSNDAFLALTGFPTVTMYMQYSEDKERLWAELLSYHEAKCILSATSLKLDALNGNKAHFGEFANHAFTVLSIRNVNGQRVLKLRNPWGKMEWKGEVGRNKVLQQSKRKEIEPNGVFRITYDELFEYFYSIEICIMRKNWRSMTFTGLLAPCASSCCHRYYEIHLDKCCEVDLLLSQKWIKKSHGKDDADHTDLGVLVFQTNPAHDLIKLVGYTRRKPENNVICSGLYDPGMYLVIPISFFHHSFREEDFVYPEFTLVAYCSKSFEMRCVSIDKPLLIGEAMGKYAMETGSSATSKKNPENYKNKILNDVEVVNTRDGVLVAQNNSSKHQYILEATFGSNHEATNSKIKFSRGAVNQTFDVLRPRTRQVIQVRSVKTRMNSLNLEITSSFRITQAGSKTTFLHSPNFQGASYNLHVPMELENSHSKFYI